MANATAGKGGPGGGTGGRQGSAEKLLSTQIPHTRLEDERQMEEVYEIGGPLGEGSFGFVREVLHRKTQKRWACKAISKEKAGSSKIKLLEREVSILKTVRHEHIICLKEVFETPQRMYLVMELCEGGELSKELKKRGRMSEDKAKIIMSRLASAIAYLHKNDMVHRDLKLENILLSRNPNDSSDKLFIKVTDFGLSVVKGGVGHDNMMMDFCGTPMYMAPEIIDNKTYGQLCDVWAMGVIMYFLISNRSPFGESSSDDELYTMIKTLNIISIINRNPDWRGISQSAKDLLEGMLTVDPAYRRSASEVLDDPWITGQSPRQGQPRTVLDMMKHYAKHGDDDDLSLLNGNSEKAVTRSISEDDVTAKNSTGLDCGSSSRDGSANSKSGKHSGRTQRNSVTPTNTKTKKLTRNSTDPNLQQTAQASSSRSSLGSKTSPSVRNSLSKSKSPIDRDTTRLTVSKGPGHHAAKPSATRTSQSSHISSSSSSSSIHSHSQRTPENHKVMKKKISR